MSIKDNELLEIIYTIGCIAFNVLVGMLVFFLMFLLFTSFGFPANGMSAASAITVVCIIAYIQILLYEKIL